MQGLVEAWAGPITVFSAYGNTDTAKKASGLRSALELAGIQIMAVDVRRSFASPASHKETVVDYLYLDPSRELLPSPEYYQA